MQPGPNMAVVRDGTVTLRIGPQGAMGLPVATICAAAIGPGTWRFTPTAGNRLQPSSFQIHCRSQEEAKEGQVALHHRASELGDLIVRLHVTKNLNRSRKEV